MPVEVGLWRVDGGIKKVDYTSMESERKLETILENDLSILSEDLLLVGRQVSTGFGKYIDLLAINKEGELVIIELKKHHTPREVVAQVLDYASWIQDLSYGDVVKLYEDLNYKPLEEDFAEVFNFPLTEEINSSHQMWIVSAGLDNETERIIQYLSSNFDVPINAVFFRYFKEGEAEFISRSWLVDPSVVEEKSNESMKDKKRESWNQRDFVFNFSDDGNYRSWEDAVKYGFVSAGNGEWYTRTLNQLFIGARIFCMSPSQGYIGIGKVVSEAQPIKEVYVDIGDESIKLVDLPLKANNMLHDIDDYQKCEYLVGVQWIKTAPIEKAFWVKGLKANQNTAFKLRSQYTIDKVEEFFGIQS
ncbi:endonuclease NucS domain-containing protein [Halobacillus halophilus]|uniref:endonuclease NucS domain-containing protein n=1 Tax=Halobacillus halophilus TaxID=1570 RepID=UPI001CD1B579|nr:endonuclease NucS domain-containing protein [Halobacillus halophilus]MCA1011765.1 endonuclease NucS [Halobacillus halophilus]